MRLLPFKTKRKCNKTRFRKLSLSTPNLDWNIYEFVWLKNIFVFFQNKHEIAKLSKLQKVDKLFMLSDDYFCQFHCHNASFSLIHSI